MRKKTTAREKEEVVELEKILSDAQKARLKALREADKRGVEGTYIDE